MTTHSTSTTSGTSRPTASEHASRSGTRPRRRLNLPWERFAMIGFFAVFYLVVCVNGTWNFLASANVFNVLGQNVHTAFAAAAITITLIVGQFDLSVGALVGLSGVLAGGLTAQQELPAIVAVAIILVVGFAAGLLNAFIVLKLRVNAFIATLGTGTAFTGLALLYTDGQLIFDGISPSIIEPMRTRIGTVPLSMGFALLLLLILSIVTRRMVFGRFLYAVGANAPAAELAGVPVRRVTVIAFVITGVVAAVGGVIATGTYGSANPNTGPELLLPAFAAAFLGASLMGSENFSVTGSIIATFLIAMALNGLDIMGLSSGAKPIFNGAVLVAAVALTQALRARRRAPSPEAKEADAIPAQA
jgi:ribose transport system permease protein